MEKRRGEGGHITQYRKERAQVMQCMRRAHPVPLLCSQLAVLSDTDTFNGLVGWQKIPAG